MNQSNPDQTFESLNQQSIEEMASSKELSALTLDWINESSKHRYTYLFTSLGRPIIQFPQDIIAIQELIWKIRPDLIIETGIAHGGSLINSASMLALIDLCDAIAENKTIDPAKSQRKVLGIDIEIRPHNRKHIESHPLASRIELIEGSSSDPNIVKQVHNIARNYQRILVCLDSNHTEQHVMAELEAYAQLTSIGSYCIIYDTIIEDMPKDSFPDRPWGQGNNPKTAAKKFLSNHPEFIIDKSIQNKLQITVSPDGYLLRIK